MNRYCSGIFLFILAAAFFTCPELVAQHKEFVIKRQQPKPKSKRTKVGFAGKYPGAKNNNTAKVKKGNVFQSAGSYSGKSLKKKGVKLGFVGEKPNRKVKKVKFIKSDIKTPKKEPDQKVETKLYKPKRNIDFIAAAKVPQNKSIKFPRSVSDRDMILPKIRGDKKAVELTKQEMRGLDPGIHVSKKSEKRMNEIQYRSAYKFDKSGKANKEHSRKNKD